MFFKLIGCSKIDDQYHEKNNFSCMICFKSRTDRDPDSYQLGCCDNFIDLSCLLDWLNYSKDSACPFCRSDQPRDDLGAKLSLKKDTKTFNPYTSAVIEILNAMPDAANANLQRKYNYFIEEVNKKTIPLFGSYIRSKRDRVSLLCDFAIVLGWYDHADLSVKIWPIVQGIIKVESGDDRIKLNRLFTSKSLDWRIMVAARDAQFDG